MNRRLAHFGIASLLLIGIPTARCQTAPPPKDAPAADAKLPSAEELSEKCAKGSGGKEAWAKLQTMVMTGTVDVPTFNVSGTFEVDAKRPNKIFRVTTMAGGQFVRKEAFDGQTGWASDSQQGLKAITGARLEQTKVEAIFDTDVRLKEVYPDLNVTGRIKIGDRDAYTAVAHEPGSKTVTMYLDAQTGLRIAEDTEGPDENGTVVKTNLLFDDYRSVGDVQIPHRIRIHAPTVSLELKIEDVKFNVPVDDAKFAMPPTNTVTGSEK
jgi:outer membrane lipoprotein-sorting protein